MSSETALQCLIDCKSLTANMLRRKYKREANSHRNMHQRKFTEGRTVHPAFKVFRDFLAHVGPCPCAKATLDRTDNTDPEYAPGKVRWADKPTQNSNKGDSLLFYYSRTRETYTVNRLAKLRKIAPNTIRKRKERGWSDDEIIESKRHAAEGEVTSNPGKSKQRNEKPQSNQPHRPETGQEIKFQRNADYAAWYRQKNGEEYCLADYELIRDTGMEFGIVVTPEGYQWKFEKWWREWRAHINRKNLPGWAQELIARIEGTSIAEIKRREDDMRARL
jgi:hypothetical protein